MILGVNGIRLMGRKSGVGRCIEALLRCFGALNHPFDEIRVYTPAPLDETIYLPPGTVNVALPSNLPFAGWEQFTLLKAHGAKNLLFCPSYVIPLAARCPTFLIHHGSYEGYPQSFGWWTLNKARAIYSLSAKRATALSTVSEFSKRDMVKFYGLNPDKINVVPEGVDTSVFRPIDDALMLKKWREKIFGTDTPFIVYVGKPTERRNLSALVKAFAALKKEGLAHKLLLVGTALPGTSPFGRIINELNLENEVLTLDYISHDEMFLVYNAAALFVYPSSYEGFGMPVLEAMACGTPLIALNNTAFPEFAGGVAHLLKDANVDTLKDGIKAVLNDEKRRARMAHDGPVRAANYDWQIVAQKYLDLMIPLAA
ncbi:MAG: glycosyltransferase family 4 protein [Pyrinomonadaceae bacterium]